VAVIDGITIRCLSRAYVPRGADVTRIERMGKFLSVVTANFVHNLLRMEGEPAYFERAVASDEPLSESGRDRFLKIGGEKGQELLAELDTFLAGLAASEKSAQGKKYGVGIYFFEDEFGGLIDTGTEVLNVRKIEETGSMQEIDVLAMPSQRK
jgi:hypothetical protein